MNKCSWALASPAEALYHDQEWGVPVHDDRLWFEFLVLEGAQAGLSWRTVLTKRDAFREAFANFEVVKVAAFDDSKLQQLMQNPLLIRNRLKLQSAIKNAQAFMRVQSEFGSFDRYIWQFTDGQVIHNQWQTVEQYPVSTPESELMSKDLKRRGFGFVGPVICYALMQATGMVNDHVTSCFRYQELTTENVCY
jgi:DNA-3-methyladenine glycosylase I